MNKKYSLFIIIVFFTAVKIFAQASADILIKSGHVIDPKNKIDEIGDIAIKQGKIIEVAPHIDNMRATQTVDAKGLIVVPGLIDIHTHFFWGSHMDQAYMDGPNALQPDGFTFRNGVTTAVDAGSSGWKTFPIFKKQTIDNSKTRILAFLNIVGAGMRGGNYEQDTTEMSAVKAAETAAANPSCIVGFKVAHFDKHSWCAVDSAVGASRILGDSLPVMIDFGGSKPALSIKELYFDHLRKGDIFTHTYAQLGSERESIVDTATGKVKDFVWKARERGIIFDVGYGGISFSFSQAIPAMLQKFYPNSISTDLHRESMNAAMKDILTVMDKCEALGMPFNDVIAAVTSNPAHEIHHDELGNLSVGSCADVAIFRTENGDFGLFDYKGVKIRSKKKLECEMTIRAGKIVYDLNGIASPILL